VNRLPPTTRWFVLDGEAVTTIDTTAAAVLSELIEELADRNLRFGIANLRGQPRELLTRSGALASIGPEMVFARASRMWLWPSSESSDATNDRHRFSYYPRFGAKRASQWERRANS
jgi:MFS superfamily sulfate permease-like transporter